jgi:hypothetical protein
MGTGSSKRFWIKDHGLVLAMCDEELLGKQIGEIVINPNFYKGELVGKEKLQEKLKNAKNINIFGKNSIKVAIELKMAEKDNCMMVGGVPHLNVVCI